MNHGSESHLHYLIDSGNVEFKMQAAKVCGLKAIHWMPFPKASGLKGYRELLGLEFLKKDNLDAWKIVHDDFPKAWRGKATMNWDAVGIGESFTGEKYYVLCEAKAHIGELGTTPRQKKQDAIIRNAFSLTKRKLSVPDEIDWVMNRYYQFANRLYVVDFLQRRKINALALSIFFYGKDFMDTPLTESGWHREIDDEYRSLGLCGHEKLVDSLARKVFVPIYEK